MVAATVLAIGAIRSIRWRALIYAIPLPITLVLVTTATRVDGSQLLGVLLLNVFVAVVALLHARAGWHILLADAAGVAVYAGLAWPIAALAPVPFVPTLTAVLLLWLLGQAILRRCDRADGHGMAAPTAASPDVLAKIATVAGSSLLVVAVGRLINGLAVTFPYAGVLVVIETRQHLGAFARQFATNSIALVAFFIAYWALQDRDRLLALGSAWLAFVTVAAILHLARKPSIRTQLPANSRNGG
ncbi:hypothetical protein [Allorhizocola rhizosphaerae]|uniref:hypothetical protein n=1 Tax=Allorhizocola rhizosphaerae TaxID=1872709 RepID=UPI000E3D44CE|nr:hypothetical protein [Allorhizocola rhizosphaerae]